MKTLYEFNDLVLQLQSSLNNLREDVENSLTKSKWLYDGWCGVLVILVPWDEGGGLVIEMDKDYLPWPIGNNTTTDTFMERGRKVDQLEGRVEIKSYEYYEDADKYFEATVL